VSFLKTGASALGKLVIIGALAAAFLAGLVGVVYLSLRGEEVKVPEIVGKDWFQSEKEIADLGLKIKKRASRYSQEKPNTILEQLPRPGETVKTGQTILVVLSEANPEGSEAPATVNKETANTETDEGTDITPEKPKSNKNSNVKKAQTTRDVISNKSNTNSNSNTNAANSNGTNSTGATNSAGNKNSSTNPANKTIAPSNSNKTEPAKPSANKPAAAKTPAAVDTRNRKVP
jgi:hypothetical protein